MRVNINIPASMGLRFTEAALEGLAQLATEDHLAGNLPPLYDSGIRYQRERGTENWLLPSQALLQGASDCEDLAAYRVGELRAHNIDPGARIVVEQTGPRTMHALVRRSDGTLEDPSVALGMRRASSPLPRMLVGVDNTQTWCELSRRSRYGTLHMGRELRECLDGAELGAELGFLPVLDTVARAAQGALTAVAPGLDRQAQGMAAMQTAARLSQAGLDVSPGEVLALAAQLARVVRAEANRRFREDQRGFQRGGWQRGEANRKFREDQRAWQRP